MGEVHFLRRNILLLVNISFFIFSAILLFLEVEATFPYSGNACLKQSFIRLVETDFLSGRKSVFWSDLAIIWIKGKQFSKKELVIAKGQVIFWLVETIFLSIFQWLLLVFLGSSGNNFSRKSFIKAKWILELIMISARRKNLLSPAGMKDSLKKYVFTMPKNLFNRQ